MPHDHPHDHPHGHGHNHAHGDHLHSHPHQDNPSGDLQILASEFIEGFTTARDKAAFLRLADVPLEIPDPEGGPSLKLVDVSLTTDWQVGTASPSFGSPELCYLPFPGSMIQERSNLGFIYVSARTKKTVDLRDFIAAREA
ncbi:MAG: hypothetical protein AAFN59_04620 [Pseudomonadota bacterium]